VTRGKGGEDVTPIIWTDNYFSLLPGEQASVRARYDDRALAGKEPVLEIEGYNVEPGAVAVGEFTAVKDDDTP
jgi:exo-1,4-beta-D-glucosaminidase